MSFDMPDFNMENGGMKMYDDVTEFAMFLLVTIGVIAGIWGFVVYYEKKKKKSEKEYRS